MAISDSLAKRVESDVKGSQEAAIEAAVKDALSDFKNKFKYQESYLSTLYDTGFQAYLKDRTFDSPEKLPKEITAINNIKLKLIKQWLEAKKSTEHSPNFVTRNVIYPICWISQDLSKNNKIRNIMKWVIDELMAIPDMVIQIFKNPAEFARSLWKLIMNPKDLWNWLKQAYGDVFTQINMGTPDAQYRRWRSTTLIVLTFLPWGAAKFWFNVAKSWVKNVGKWISKVTAKNTVKSTVKNATKSTVKNATKSAPAKSILTKTEKWLKWHKAWNTMYRELNWWAKTYAEKQVTKNANRIKTEAGTATKAGRAAEMPAKTPWILGRWVEKMVRFWDKIPVIKQINSITRWTFKKLDKWTEAVVKKLHPKFYEKLAKQEASLQKIKTSVENAAKNLNAQSASVERAAKKVAEQKAKITEIERALASKTGKKYNMGHLNRAKTKLAKLEWDLKTARRAESNLRTKLKNANEKYLVHQSIIEWMNEAQRAGKLALWIETQQVVSILDRSQIATLDREIEEAISQIDETYDEIIEESEPIIEEVENLLKEFEWIASGLESGQTEFNNDSISIDLPEWVDLSKIDTKSYKIVITGLASKTWSREVNERIAKQRAENAKKLLMEKYWIKDEWQIDIQIDLQADHPDSLNDNLSDWQWVKIKLESNKSNDIKDYNDNDDPDPDQWIQNELENI